MATACCTAVTLEGDTPASPLTTRDTVFGLTPASSATSRRVGRPLGGATPRWSSSSCAITIPHFYAINSPRCDPVLASSPRSTTMSRAPALLQGRDYRVHDGLLTRPATRAETALTSLSSRLPPADAVEHPR